MISQQLDNVVKAALHWEHCKSNYVLALRRKTELETLAKQTTVHTSLILQASETLNTALRIMQQAEGILTEAVTYYRLSDPESTELLKPNIPVAPNLPVSTTTRKGK